MPSVVSDQPVTSEDLERETEALLVLTDEFSRTRDPDKIAELTLMTQAQSERLRDMAERMGQQHEEAWAEEHAGLPEGDPLRGQVQIQLSPGQIARVEALTGQRIESILVRDPTGTLTLGMHATEPSQVELWAVRDVLTLKRQEDASAEAARVDEAAHRRIDAIKAVTGFDPEDEGAQSHEDDE